jgi:hypothetical protein
MNTDASKYLSKRFALERFLGLTKDEILRNEKLWKDQIGLNMKNLFLMNIYKNCINTMN